MRQTDLNRRRDRIVALLSKHKELSAQDLSTMLGVSVQTIRTDLRDLDDAALVQRRNGAARLRSQTEHMAYSPRESLARTEKNQIAALVQALIPNAARFALGTGTTVETCSRFLAQSENLFVATNSIHAVLALQNAPGAVVEMAGGQVRLRDLDFVGAESQRFFQGFRMDHAIFSCGGVSETGDILDYNSHEIAARSAISGCAKERILVVDSRKIGLDLPCAQHALWDYDVIVTAADISEPVRKRCADAGCRILSPSSH